MSDDAMKAKIYIGFDDWKDVESQFQAALGPEPEIIYARYDQGGYEGDANIIFKRGDQWIYVRGGHCSCYGLEGQWNEDPFDPAGHLESVKQGRREISMYDAGEEGRLELDRWIEWHSRPTLRAALTPPADDEIEAIRARHEERMHFSTQPPPQIAADFATLLRALDAERARRVEVEWEVERLEEEGADFVRSQFLPELDEFSNLLLIDFLWVSSALLGNLDWLTEVTGEAPEDEDAIMVAEARKRYEHYRDLQANARAATITKETP